MAQMQAKIQGHLRFTKVSLYMAELSLESNVA